MDLADVVRRHGPTYLQKYGARMPRTHHRALEAILRCHTPACGGSLYVCDGCGHQHFAYHSCGHRACGQCGHRRAQAWCERQGERLLPVGYFLVTFTVPEALRTFLRQHQRLAYHLLFQESAGTLQDVAKQPRYLGGTLGLLGVLHTWTRQLVYHPHVHYLVPGVAWREDGTLCFPKEPDFLVPVQRLSTRFAARFRQRLRTEASALYPQIPSSVWRQKWVVHCAPAGHGPQALSYLSRYIYKTAISSARLVSQDDQSVTFTYRDSKTRQQNTCTLASEEFLRRFLQHVLPKGFQRVRHYGWLGPAAKQTFTSISVLLAASVPASPKRSGFAVILLCAHCQKPLRRVADIARAPP